MIPGDEISDIETASPRNAAILPRMYIAYSDEKLKVESSNIIESGIPWP